MTSDNLLKYLERLKLLLITTEATEVHFPIIDPEHPLRNLADFCHCLKDVFVDATLPVFLHDRTYVSIASIVNLPDAS